MVVFRPYFLKKLLLSFLFVSSLTARAQIPASAQANLQALHEKLEQLGYRIIALDPKDLRVRFFTQDARDREKSLMQKNLGRLTGIPEASELAQCLQSISDSARLKNCKRTANALRTRIAGLGTIPPAYDDLSLQISGLIDKTQAEIQALRNKYDQLRNGEYLPLRKIVQDAQTQMDKLVFADALAHSSDLQCGPGMPEIRLDAEGQIDGAPIRASLLRASVQDQDQLGSCFLNTTSLVLEGVTGIAASALYLSQLSQPDPSKIDSSGDVCALIKQTRSHGFCARQDSWVESSLVNSSKVMSDRNHLQFKTLAQIHRLLTYRSTAGVAGGSLETLLRSSPWVLSQVREFYRLHAADIEEPVSRLALYLNARIQYLVPDIFQAKALYDLSTDYLDHRYLTEILPDPNSDADQKIAIFKVEIQELFKGLPAAEPILQVIRSSGEISSGIREDVQNDLLDRLARHQRIHQDLSTTLSNASQSCADPAAVEDFLMTSADLGYRALQASSDSSFGLWLDRDLADLSVPIQDLYTRLLTPNCADPRNLKSASDLYCEKIEIPATVALDHPSAQAAQDWRRYQILQSLRDGIPVPIRYCGDILYPEKRANALASGQPLCAIVTHSSAVTGMRYNASRGQCEYMIWNSWGTAYPKVWLPESELLKFATANFQRVKHDPLQAIWEKITKN